MFDLNILIILSMAFGLGMLHALDADHIAMVTSLSSSHAGFRKSVLYCSRWALGHALTLMLLGVLVLVIGIQIPPQYSELAELLIGVFLVLLGLWLLWDLRQQHIHIHFHVHDGLPEHAHWHSHHQDNSHRHQHRAMFIGSLHGFAGSAPLLALIPVAVNQQPLTGMLYLLLFSLGVITAMLLFGGLLSIVTRYLAQLSHRLLIGLRILISLATITVGGLLMAQVWQ